MGVGAMLVRMRYVVAKRNSDGSMRWYWQRKGFPVTRLPVDENRRMAMAARLNESANAQKAAEPSEGTIAWAIDKYRQSEAFTNLAPNSRKIYEQIGRAH